MQELTSAQARATVSETRSKPSRITLASATSTNPRRRANAALSGQPPRPRRGRWAVARIAAKPFRRQRGRLALGGPDAPANAQEGRRRNRTGGGGEAGELVRLDHRAPRLAHMLANAKPWPASRVR